MSVKKIANLYPPKSVLQGAPRLNYENAPAFARTDEESLIRVLMTGTGEPTYYASARDLAQEAVAIFERFAQTDPRFLARAIIYARNEGYMRLAPITALVSLSKAADHAAFYSAFRQTIKTPGDLQDFLTLVRVSKMRGMGRKVKTAAGMYLAGLSEYHVIKYGSESQQMSLRDMFRLVRPKLHKDSLGNYLAHYVTKGEWAEELTPQVAAYEQFKKAEGSEDIARLITDGRLPHEVVTARLPNEPALWDAVMCQMPIFALLRNLVTLYRHNVFERTGAVDYATGMLTNPERIQRSKMFPFRFLAAARQASKSGLPTAIVQALEGAVELALANVPQLAGRVLIANDVSGSMQSAISEKSDLTCADVAGVLAGALYRKCANARIVSFNQGALPREHLGGRGMLEIANLVAQGGGGTHLGAPLEWALANKERFDVGVFITDSEDWVGWLGSGHLSFGSGYRPRYPHGAIDLLRAYKKLSPGFKAFFLQVMPYEHAVVPPEEQNCWYCYGWSPETLRYIAANANLESQLSKVRRVRLEETEYETEGPFVARESD